MDVKRIYLEGACFFCLSETHMTWCKTCEQDIIHNVIRCQICARSSLTNKPCGNCIKCPPYFSQSLILFDYQYPANELIKAFKFGKRAELAFRFAEKFVERLINADKLPDSLIPVPLHKTRQRARGYNQSLELAKHISRMLNISLDTTSCKRIKNTETQSTLSTKARERNVKDAFILTNHVLPKHVAIIDDVITTGSTVNEIARLLKRSGCEQVDVWAIARA